MSITVIKTEVGYSVKFPFELKDNFKSVFKSAKWDKHDRSWSVGLRSKKRLDQWIDVVSEAVKEIEETEAAVLTEHEVIELQSQISSIRAELAASRQIKVTYEQSIEAMNSAKDQLDIAQSELENEKNQVISARDKAIDLLSKVCDMDTVENAHRIMKQNTGKKTSASREKYSDAKELITEQIRKLEKVGFESAGLSELAECNFNRPDRDDPRSVSTAHILNIRRTEE